MNTPTAPSNIIVVLDSEEIERLIKALKHDREVIDETLNKLEQALTLSTVPVVESPLP